MRLRGRKLNDTEQKFIEEIQQLFEKYNVKLVDYDNYDGEENFSGTDYYLKGEDIYLDIESILP